MIRTLLAAALIGATAVSLPAPAHAEKAPIYTGFLSKTAVEGHDTVAYFTEGRPVQGKKQFSTQYQGAEWRFASQENLDLFLADPEKYAPQYGGYCAWAVAQGDTAKGDANHWKIVDGKLYLNYNKKIQKDWELNQSQFIESANAKWPDVLN